MQIVQRCRPIPGLNNEQITVCEEHAGFYPTWESVMNPRIECGGVQQAMSPAARPEHDQTQA